MRKHISIGLVSIILLWFSSANAALDLVLTQGINAALPIAIVPFVNEQEAIAPGNQTITTILKNDLQNSGQFWVKTAVGLSHSPSNVNQIDFKYWRKQGVNDVVVGSVNALGDGRYQIVFQLVNLFNQSAKASQSDRNNAVLLSRSITARAAALRQLAHYISDLIYQQLTGVPGIFNTKIAYVLVQRSVDQAPKYTLEVADEDGFKPQALLTSSQPIMSPNWSPDGNKIAYVSFESDQPAIYIQDVATGQRQIISEFPGINGAPAFSPDGKYLALVLTRTGNPKIYVLALASGKLTQITNGYSIDTEPAWAPDGKSLLFTSNRGGTPQIYLYNFETNQVQRISFDGNYNARASFLPNKRDIVMMHRETGMFGIARQDLESGRLQVLVQTGNDESPSLSPNGKMVLYATQYGGRAVLAMVSTDGRVKLRLPEREGSVQEPAWSPYEQQ